jgi:diaminopimelate epimerase
MGNPHLVLLGAPPEVVAEHGPRLEHLPGFPDRTNVEAVSRSAEGLRVSVWERGSGLTDACGTGAVASVAAALVAGWVPPDVFVPVELPGGRLTVRVSADLQRTTLRGPARFVFAAELPEALLD